MITDFSTDETDIAPGYRNISIQNINGIQNIVLWGYSKATGKPTIFLIPHTCKVFYRVKYNTPLKDIYGNNIAMMEFKNSYDRKKWLDSKGSIFVVQALNPIEEFLHDTFNKYVLDNNFNTQPLHIHYIDIETEVSDEFEKPVSANNRINLITVYDSEEKVYFSWSLTNVKNTFKDKSKYCIFNFDNDEAKLLRHYCRWVEKHCPDMIVGYNSRYYDMPYIVRRIENVLGEQWAKYLSPVKRYRIKQTNPSNARGPKSEEIYIDLDGISQMDLLLLYRDKFCVRACLDGGYGLSNVGEAEGLGRKLEYDGTIKDFYLRDFQTFYEYNVRDVELVVKIEEKCKLIPLARRLTSSGLCKYESIYASVGYITGSLVAFSMNEFKTIFPSYINTPNSDQAYEGAYVFPTQIGMYTNGICTVDFNSLYPNTMVSINLSPETYVGRLIEPYDENSQEYHLKLNRTGEIKTISNKDMKSILDNKCILTKNDTLFVKHKIKWGVVSSWCKHFYQLRKAVKKDMEKYISKKLQTVDEKEKENLQVTVDNLNVMQLGLKTQINSCYGLFGTIFSPFYNTDLAQSITRQGRWSNISASEYIKKYFSEKFNAGLDYITTISGDTDSQFINLECVTKALAKKHNITKPLQEWTKEQKTLLWDEMNNFTETNLNPYIQNLIHTYCHTDEENNVRYSLEYMADSGIYEAKKHYAIHKIFDDGNYCDKFKYSGIELKKATVPKEIKTFLKEIYEQTLKGGMSYQDYTSYINNAYEKFKVLPIESIAIWKGYNTAKDVIGFLKLSKGAGIHVRASEYYNALLKKLNISDKYNSINVGDRIRYVYLYKNNDFGIDCIAYKDQYPKEFNSIFKIDYETMFQKLIIQPLRGYQEARKFSQVNPSNQMETDIFSL